MGWKPQSQTWPRQTAVLFIHGIGSAKPGHYDSLLQLFDKSIGPGPAQGIAKYCIYYDDLNDWFQDKVGLASQLTALQGFLRQEAAAETDPGFGAAVAAYLGDVLLPILNEAARISVRDRILAQLQQIRLDGHKSGVQYQNQKISIVCHSMGCFHTYEALHAAATDPDLKLMPISDLMQFRSVLFMASPVQLIRTVAQKIGALVPKGHLAVLSDQGIFRPFETNVVTGQAEYCARNWVSIAGNLDPVGGNFFKKLVPWAYMSPQGQESIIDDQGFLNIKDKMELIGILSDIALKGEGSAEILRDPHSWNNYVANHATRITQWIA
ncbi:MAG: hypothetical protein JWO30_687 [Fibrobacteres bacterium]|nr:hypothetical protein [Fibrobacterota bacterium]